MRIIIDNVPPIKPREPDNPEGYSVCEGYYVCDREYFDTNSEAILMLLNKVLVARGEATDPCEDDPKERLTTGGR